MDAFETTSTSPALVLPFGLWRGFSMPPRQESISVRLAAGADLGCQQVVERLLDHERPERVLPLFAEPPLNAGVLLAVWLEELETDSPGANVLRAPDRQLHLRLLRRDGLA
jgi:hypothetical protein